MNTTKKIAIASTTLLIGIAGLIGSTTYALNSLPEEEAVEMMVSGCGGILCDTATETVEWDISGCGGILCEH